MSEAVLGPHHTLSQRTDRLRGCRGEDVHPAHLRPLIEVVDPDALERIFRDTKNRTRQSGHVTFRYEDRVVTVPADGTLDIDHPP